MAPLTDLTIYAEPHNPALSISDFVLDLEHAALVITDPQIDFLSPEGVSWPVFGDSIRDNTPSLREESSRPVDRVRGRGRFMAVGMNEPSR
jgi:hypothetical protein